MMPYQSPCAFFAVIIMDLHLLVQNRMKGWVPANLIVVIITIITAQAFVDLFVPHADLGT